MFFDAVGNTFNGTLATELGGLASLGAMVLGEETVFQERVQDHVQFYILSSALTSMSYS